MLHTVEHYRDADHALLTVACRPTRVSETAEVEQAHSLVLPRRGCFVRETGRDRTVVDVTLAYFTSSGEEQVVSHPRGGDECTVVVLGVRAARHLFGDDGTLPRTVRVGDGADAAHRMLLRAAARETCSVEERLVRLVGDLASAARDHRRARPASAARHRRLADDARALLSTATRHHATLVDLAATLECSPHHLSRVFSTHVGMSVTAYRVTLRLRSALDLLAAGATPAQAAAAAGFADQAHLTRTARARLGMTPRALAGALA